jgi:capsular exopolysaccharide synthesis family protein
MNQQLPPDQPEEIHLKDYLNVIRGRRRAFLISFLSVLSVVTLYTFLVPPSYESCATLFVKDDKGKVGQMGDLLLNAAAPVDSELEILKSRSNAEKVVARLHLDWKIDRVSDGLQVKPLEFSSTALTPVYRVTLLAAGAYEVRDDDGALAGTGQTGSLLRGKGVTLLLKELKGDQGDSFRITQLPFNKTVEDFRKEVKAVEVGKKTNVISVTYRNRDPLLARDVVNTLVQAYLEQRVAIKTEEATRTVGFVEEQLKGTRAELEGAEMNLQSYKSASGVIQLDTEAQNLIKTLTEAETQRAEATLQRKQAEFALASLKEARRREVLYAPTLLRDDPLVAGLATRLAELEVQKRGLLSESTESHPGVKSVQAQIDETQKKIQATYESAIKGFGKQEETISREIGRLDGQLKKLPVAERDLARLMRLSKVNADIYTFLLQKHEEARIAKASTISNINVVDPAIVADKPASPKKLKNLFLGLVAGLIAGIGLCFFREYLDDTLKDPEQIKRALALPLLSVIPFIQAKDGNPALITHHSPRSPASEAFRSLRTGLHFCGLHQQNKVLLVTSTFPGEGKSTIAANLAITLAQTGAKVLLVDCDLRRSCLHDKLGLPKMRGLTELLAGDIDASAAAQASQVSGLDLIQCGANPPNPSEMLGSPAMARFIEQVSQSYNHVIIDAPPVLAVTDAQLLCGISDLVVMVLETGRVPAKAALRTRELLAAVSASVAGLVVSNKNERSVAYGYGYGYGYGDQVDETAKKSWWRRK